MTKIELQEKLAQTKQALAEWRQYGESQRQRADLAEKALAAERNAVREFAKRALFGLMSDLSEWCWSAGWLLGTESFLWSAVENGQPAKWGVGTVEQKDIDDLLLMRNLAGGWWVWKDHPTPEFVSLDDMRRRMVEG